MLSSSVILYQNKTLKMEIKKLNNIDPEILLNTFNYSFSDYLVPFHLSIEQLKFKIISDKIDFNLSVGVFEQNQLCGFILHGKQLIDGKNVVYNGGTGVIPEKRGLGLVIKMYQFILPKLTELGCDYLVLEVITKNASAIKAYEKLDYTKTRKLLCFKGSIKNVSKTPNYSIKPISTPDWDLFQTFWDFKPTWQNSNFALEQIQEHCHFIGAYQEKKLVGYMIYGKSSNKIYQFAVNKDCRRKGIGTELFKTASENNTNTIAILNIEDTAHHTAAFLKQMGFDAYIEQYEMQKKLEQFAF